MNSSRTERSPVLASDGETANGQETAGDLSRPDSNTNTAFHSQGTECALSRAVKTEHLNYARFLSEADSFTTTSASQSDKA